MKYQSVEHYNKTVKVLLEKSLSVCKTDINYIKEAENLLNKIDSFFESNPLYIADFVVNMMNILSNNQYYQNVHRSSPEEEKKLLRQISEELSMFRKLVIYDFQHEVKETPKTNNRLPNDTMNLENVYAVKAKERLF